jgi:hypothetical protein
MVVRDDRDAALVRLFSAAWPGLPCVVLPRGTFDKFYVRLMPAAVRQHLLRREKPPKLVDDLIRAAYSAVVKGGNGLKTHTPTLRTAP